MFKIIMIEDKYIYVGGFICIFIVVLHVDNLSVFKICVIVKYVHG